VTGPNFSVILPVYNGALSVGRAIDSVRAQTETDWEIVAVDDGSKDSSWDILRDASGQDDRIRVFRMTNSGSPARPRNKAISESRGTAICFLDQDDYWLPEKLALQRPMLERPGVGIVHGDAWVEGAENVRRLYSQLWGPAYSGQVAGELIKSNFIPTVTAVVPASVALAVGPLDERLVGVDEYHWWLRIALAGYRVEGVAEPLAVYTMADDTLSTDHDRRIRSLDACFRDLAARHRDWRRPLRARREEERLHAFDYIANRLARHGLTQPGGVSDALRVARLTRSWPEAKRLFASALPPGMRPRTGRTA
jgi:glycosyltransferase involved in cell wall biosynthesis